MARLWEILEFIKSDVKRVNEKVIERVWVSNSGVLGLIPLFRLFRNVIV